ncbi:MAG TPA: hypothetical protein VK934_12970 [Fimbriimonas sp.]|nr:hypothetical protein [Fimbriimonas sp.]
MNFKTLGFTVVAAASIAAPSTAAAQFDMKTLETVAAMLLADKLGIDASSILQATLGQKASVYDMAPAFVMQRAAPRTTATSIWDLRRQGMGWGEIAHKIGMQPGEFNKLRNSGQLDSNVIWRSRYENRFGLTSAQMDDLRKKGLTWREIGTATLIARESGTNVYDVAHRYVGTRSWDRVAAQYGISGPRLANRVTTWRTTKTIPTTWRTYTKAKPKSSSSHGSAALKIKGHAVAHEKSNGKGHEKHHDDKSKGKGHGGGH